MSCFVSLETAIRLRDAGFPQPEFKFGQLWETENGRHFAFVGTAQFNLLKLNHLKEIVFRPTATDILLHLPDYAIVFSDVYEPKGFSCYDTMRRIADQYPVTAENPAEAAALAWLEIHEKKQP